MDYRLLIADDSEIQVESILTYVNWQDFGVSQIRTARDGEEALSVYREFRPHIVILDVEMPKLDGLELARIIREQDTKVKMIFISCHEKFSYAQKAMSYGGCAYILKPISYVEIEDVARNVISELDHEYRTLTLNSTFLHRQEEFDRQFASGDTDSNGKLDIFSIKEEIQRFIDNGNEDVEEFFKDKYFSSNMDFDRTKYLCYTIVNALQLVSKSCGIDMDKLFGTDEIFWNKIATFDKSEDIIHWLCNLLHYMVKHIITIDEDKYKRLVNEIKSKIDRSIYEIDTVEQIAKELNISSSHAKNVFKKYTGITIFDYLFEKRMDEAKKLLSDTDLHIYQIAEKLGYRSKAYFSSAFQKYTGVTPNAWRKDKSQ